MKNDTIINTNNSYFKYKTIKFENYEIKYGKYNIPYVVGLGEGSVELISTNDTDIVRDIVSICDYFKECPIINLVNSLDEYLNRIKDKYFVSGNKIIFDSHDSLIIGDYFNYYYLKLHPELKEERILFSATYSVVLAMLETFFKKYGLPENLTSKTNNMINLHEIIKKLDDVYNFINLISNKEKKYNEIEISLAKVGLSKNKNNELEMINYFDCPFEYSKYNILIGTLIGTFKIIKCKFCNSIIISRRKDQLFCNNNCRAKNSKKKRKN